MAGMLRRPPSFYKEALNLPHMDDVDNVLIFVSDSLRWDYLPDSMKDRGTVFKTVAQSTYSPPSFTTLSTGLYPTQHGVNGFDKKLADGVQTTYHIPGIDGAYFNEGRMLVDSLYRTYGVHEQKSLASLDSPFWYLERDTTTHAAFVPNPFFRNIDVDEYFADRMPDWSIVRDDYRDTIDKSIELFDKRLRVLKRISELENTLVVFTSDHGELFGEYGDILHISPMSPELVYVPTVFIHPSLSDDSFAADPETDVIEHTDVVQTCLSAIGRGDAIPTEGIDLLSDPHPRDFGYSHTTTGKFGITGYQANGIWWPDSGFVTVENSRAIRLAYMFHKLIFGTGAAARRRYFPEVIGTYLKDEWTFGELPVPRERAVELLRDVSGDIVRTTSRELDSRTKSHLRDLGYR